MGNEGLLVPLTQSESILHTSFSILHSPFSIPHSPVPSTQYPVPLMQPPLPRPRLPIKELLVNIKWLFWLTEKFQLFKNVLRDKKKPSRYREGFFYACCSCLFLNDHSNVRYTAVTYNLHMVCAGCKSRQVEHF